MLKFKEVNIDKLSGKKNRGNLFEFLEEIEHANVPAVEIEWKDHYSSESSASGSFQAAIKGYNKNHLKCFQRDGHVYITNDLAIKK